GTWRAIYQEEWSATYVERLEEEAKKGLVIWPYHTMLGTPGHGLTPALSEAMAYHAAAREANPRFILKGLIPQTEFYSLFEPEVKVDDDPMGRLNEEFLNQLVDYDLIYVAGQAKSHCVLESIASIIQHRSELTAKIRLLEDCTSSVVHPEIDFEAMANEAYARFEEHGLRRVYSTDPVE
ncbi:MAG: isochorismatase, partial [Anaerolineales bacterium]